jgi:hypothetical protein
MTPEAVFERAAHIAHVRSGDPVSKPIISSALVATREIRSWVDAQEAALIGRLSAVDSFPEATIAETSKRSLGHATTTRERAVTLADTPSLAAALGHGRITSGHIDAVTRGSKQLDPEQRDQLLERADALTDVAAAATVEQFARRMKLEVRRMQADDGDDRLIRQRKNVRMRMWTDADGMWNLHGTFDPVSGVRLASKIDHAVQTLFAETTPELCPSDPIEKQKFLAAHALDRLIRGAVPTSRSGRPEYIVVIDADAPDEAGPVAQWPIPVEVPARVLAELAGDADVHAVVVRNGVVIHAPGNLDLGRSTRLANRPQRRALRAVYRTCAIPGCSVTSDRCKLHHVIWWRHGGRTDLDNLLPVCSRHHTKIHHDGWVVESGPNRQLTLRLPDGAIRTTGPPTIRAA